MGRLANDVEELEVYQRAFTVQLEIFKISQSFPKEEQYSLTSQIRRSSRRVGANIREAWAKRRYPLHFASKLTDAMAEGSETVHWLKTAVQCEYLASSKRDELVDVYNHIGAMLNKMIGNAESWKTN